MSKARQLKTLVAYVLKHEIVFASGSPRISQFEVEVLNKAGYLMQSEQGLHEDRHFYPLWSGDFKLKALKEFGIYSPRSLMTIYSSPTLADEDRTLLLSMTNPKNLPEAVARPTAQFLKGEKA